MPRRVTWVSGATGRSRRYLLIALESETLTVSSVSNRRVHIQIPIGRIAGVSDALLRLD
jgi:hypothetical protein